MSRSTLNSQKVENSTSPDPGDDANRHTLVNVPPKTAAASELTESVRRTFRLLSKITLTCRWRGPKLPLARAINPSKSSPTISFLADTHGRRSEERRVGKEC